MLNRLPYLSAFTASACVLLQLPAWAAHPLDSDDTGTQGSGHWQLEINTDRSRSRAEGQRRIEQQLNTTLSYGLSDAVDLALSQPYAWQRPSQGPKRSDVGDTSIGLKWRFHDNQAGWTWGLKPSLSLPVASERRGFGNGRTTASLELLSNYQAGDWLWQVNSGATYNDNRTGDRKALWNASTALLYSPDKSWTLAAEFGSSRNPSRSSPAALRSALLGAIYHWGDDCDLDLGLRRHWQRRVAANTLGLGFTQRW